MVRVPGPGFLFASRRGELGSIPAAVLSTTRVVDRGPNQAAGDERDLR